MLREKGTFFDDDVKLLTVTRYKRLGFCSVRDSIPDSTPPESPYKEHETLKDRDPRWPVQVVVDRSLCVTPCIVFVLM